ncbi:MAG TPA: hypothetical protein VFW71_10665 [Actinomycetota bacterium]|nr:hypothetical protein [Actinomycetota bacterium]
MKVETPPESPRPVPEEPARDSWVRRHLLAICLAVFCTAGAVWVVQQVGFKGLMDVEQQNQAPPPAVLAKEAAESKTFTPIVQHIYDVTNQALQQRDVSLLDDIYVRTCQCFSQAKAEIDQLLSSHEILRGDGQQLLKVEALTVQPKAALLQVTDKVAPYPVENEQGQVVGQGPGRVPTPFTMDLALTNGTWKVSDIVLQDDSLP